MPRLTNRRRLLKYSFGSFLSVATGYGESTR
jgi:hypothetical protein